MFKKLAEEQAQTLLEQLDCSERDCDFNPKIMGTGRKYISVGVYFFEANIQESEGDED